MFCFGKPAVSDLKAWRDRDGVWVKMCCIDGKGNVAIFRKQEDLPRLLSECQNGHYDTLNLLLEPNKSIFYWGESGILSGITCKLMQDQRTCEK